jgi:hypothetical protein
MMSETNVKHITVKLDDISHLFVAPEFDPFSDQEAELLGQPALAYVLRQLGPGTVRKKHPLRLTVQLPPDRITPDLKARADQALARFCAAHIADREAQLRILNWNGWRSLPSAVVALAVCLSLATLFLNGVFSFLPNVINQLLGEGFVIISWVVVWHPVEAFLYDPLPLRREVSALRYAATLELVIEPQQSGNG